MIAQAIQHGMSIGDSDTHRSLDVTVRTNANNGSVTYESNPMTGLFFFRKILSTALKNNAPKSTSRITRQTIPSKYESCSTVFLLRSLSNHPLKEPFDRLLYNELFSILCFFRILVVVIKTANINVLWSKDHR